MEDPTDEAFSDVEEGEDPYYPETERVHTTTTRSGRMVYTPQRLVVDPYVDDGSDEPDSMAVETSDSECDSGSFEPGSRLGSVKEPGEQGADLRGLDQESIVAVVTVDLIEPHPRPVGPQPVA